MAAVNAIIQIRHSGAAKVLLAVLYEMRDIPPEDITEGVLANWRTALVSLLEAEDRDP